MRNIVASVLLLSLVCAVPLIPMQTKLKDCKIRINEYNIGTHSPDDQFIELGAVCSNDRRSRSKIDMKFFKLIILTPYGEISTVCKFDGSKQFKTTKTWFFVLGGSNVDNRDMSLRDCAVNNWLKNSARYLPDGSVLPHAVILAYNQRPEILNFLQLQEDGNMKKLDVSEIKTLSKYMQDMYIYGSMTPYITCDLFMELLKPFGAEDAQIVRDWQVYDAATDYSVNRCDLEMEAFKPKQIIYSSPTPNEVNNCHSGFQFTIESVLPQLAAARKDALASATSWQNCYIINNTPLSNVIIAEPERYSIEMQYAETSAGNPVAEPMEVDSDPTPMDDVIQHVPPSTEFDIDVSTIPNAGQQKFLWDTCDPFPQQWTDQLTNDPLKPVDVNIIKRSPTCSWYELLPSGSGRCKFCYALHRNGILVDKKQKITKIMTEGGYMYREGTELRYVNKRAIEAHEKSKLHELAIQYFQNYDNGLRGKDLENAMLEKGKPYRMFFDATENLHIIVYQSVRMKLRPYNFEVLVQLLEHFGIKLGSHHNSPKGFRLILMNIDDMMRRDILQYLLKTEPEISITVDTSTDIAGVNSMAVVFQVFVEGNPKTFFYRLLPTVGESGAELFTVLKTAIENDGIADYIKRKMSGLVTDGCPAMTCTFLAAMREYISKGFIFNHCYSHRLELASKNALKNFTMTVRTESGVNEIASFYGPKSPKRRRVLHDHAARDLVPQFELRRIMQIRWVASKNRAATSICQHWKTIVDATEDISKDKSFDTKTRSSATNLLTLLKDGTFLITLAWLADTTKYLKEVSESLQLRATTLIGKREAIDNLKGRLEDMKYIYGDFVSLFLNNAGYNNVAEGTCELRNLGMTIQDFETKSVTLFGVPLNQPASGFETVRLHDHMDAYLTRMITNLDFYYNPDDKAENFDIFHQKTIDRDGQLPNYGEEVLEAMNNKFEWGFRLTNLYHDWKILIQKIKSHPDFTERLADKPEDFWRHFLTVDDAEGGWTDLTRSLLKNVLSVTATSSEVERIFSMVTNEKTKQRYSLKVETVSALVNINFNGASNLKFFDSYRYAKEFMKNHIRADDDGRRVPAKKDVDDEDSFLSIFG